MKCLRRNCPSTIDANEREMGGTLVKAWYIGGMTSTMAHSNCSFSRTLSECPTMKVPWEVIRADTGAKNKTSGERDRGKGLTCKLKEALSTPGFLIHKVPKELQESATITPLRKRGVQLHAEDLSERLAGFLLPTLWAAGEPGLEVLDVPTQVVGVGEGWDLVDLSLDFFLQYYAWWWCQA